MKEQMKRSLGEEFEEIEIDNSKKFWSSCFYLVLK